MIYAYRMVWSRYIEPACNFAWQLGWCVHTLLPGAGGEQATILFERRMDTPTALPSNLNRAIAQPRHRGEDMKQEATFAVMVTAVAESTARIDPAAIAARIAEEIEDTYILDIESDEGEDIECRVRITAIAAQTPTPPSG